MKIQLNTILIKSGLSVLVAGSLFLFSGCLKTTDPLSAEDYLNQAIASVNKTQLAADLLVIDDSLEMWDFTPMILKDPTNGVRYKIETLGTGDKPTLNNRIKIKYSGKLLTTGEEFDASESAEFYLYGLITGFQTTMPLISKGSVITMYMPSGYAYGPTDFLDNTGKVIIPRNSNLIFEVELLDIR
ncbi:MAG: FKBP-type peptidyl-prolyl cis-trans isomerase [Cyclobacteriaceae bacterium]|nr:FKBP-type peptidyl-prolyl cis-trans isomerase [Cyclobacteriaceae bacterium]